MLSYFAELAQIETLGILRNCARGTHALVRYAEARL